MPATINIFSIYSLVSLVVHVIGIANAGHAVMNVRSSRGAIAWSISLITFPWVAIPLYWIFGRTEFRGYSEAINRAYHEHRNLARYADEEIAKFPTELPDELATIEKLTTKIGDFPVTNNNALELLIDGKQTFTQMLQAIAIARNYILLQSYIIRNDETGNKFKSALIAKAREGVRIYLLYDALGSRKLDRSYLKSLRRNGIEVNSFRSTKGKGNRFQLNFRNHRKILIVDGHIGFMGGLNIGDEYLGKNTRFKTWRDTHLKIEGTNVKSLQRTFLKDWYWATKKIPEVSWSIEKNNRYNQTALVLATGPADRLELCTMFFLNLINLARDRLWIASPYFVPDDSTLNALKLAALRGVDVRLILPDRPDHLLVYLCSFSYYAELQKVGIKLYRYRNGFMHQKIFLCDRIIAGVGTVNLDNRSFFLNFEVTLFSIKSNYEQNAMPSCSANSTGERLKPHLTPATFLRASAGVAIAPDLVESVEQMLLNDFDASRLIDLEQYQHKPFWFRLSAEVSRLLAPIL